MKKRLLKIALLLLAVLTTGSVKAATETYDFKNIAASYVSSSSAIVLTNETDPGDHSNRIAWDDTKKIGVFKLSFSDGNDYINNFNDRFACATGKYSLRNNGAYQGLWNQGAYDNLFAILDLKIGDKVTITQKSGETNYFSYQETYSTSGILSLSDGTSLESGTEYTVQTDGNLVLRAPSAGIHVEKIVIEHPVTSVPVTINIIPDATTEEYDFQALGKAQASEGFTDVNYGTEILKSPASIKLISFSTETFNDRFAGNRDWAIRKHNSDTYCGLCNKNGWNGRYLTICDLKVGDKVSIKFTCDDGQSLIFNNAIVNGVSANDAVVSEQVYTVIEDGHLILNEGLNTESKRVYIYKITIEPADVSTGTYIGATLVSSYALDFSDVDDITAYVATAANAGSVTFSPVTKVAANTPLYIKANEESGSVINVNVPEATEGAVDYSATNLLKGSASSTTPLQSTNKTKYYVFGVKSDEAGFYPVSTSSTFTSAAGKAYLELTADQASAARSIRMIFGDGSDITGINTAVVEKESRDDAWYTLQGARVSKPAHGIYIKNGKKIFVK